MDTQQEKDLFSSGLNILFSINNMRSVDCCLNFIRNDHRHFVIIHVNLKFQTEPRQLQEGFLMPMELELILMKLQCTAFMILLKEKINHLQRNT